MPTPPVALHERVREVVRRPGFSSPRERIYVDSSVLEGCEVDELRRPSERLIDGFVRGAFVLVLSDLTQDELTQAPAVVQRHLDVIPAEHLEIVHRDVESRALAGAYVAAGVFKEPMRILAEHVALASVARATMLASWILGRGPRSSSHEPVNRRLGYEALPIRSPNDVWTDD